MRTPLARLGATPTSTTGYPWVDGDLLYAADLNAAFVPSGGGTVNGDFGVTGTVNINGGAHVAGAATVGGLLGVTGPADFGSNASVVGNVDVGGGLDVTHDASVGGALGVTGNAGVGTLGVTGNASVGGSLGVGSGMGVIQTSAAYIFQFDPGYSWAVRGSDGFCYLTTNNILQMTMDTASNFTVVGAALKPGGGSWTATSDARIKDVIGDYSEGLDVIRRLRPKRYRFKGNDGEFGNAVVARRGDEFVGFTAQDIEGVLPETVSKVQGEIDGQRVNDLRRVNTDPVFYALVVAVQELAAEVEALKAAARQ